jgi:hypothetical protein
VRIELFERHGHPVEDARARMVRFDADDRIPVDMVDDGCVELLLAEQDFREPHAKTVVDAIRASCAGAASPTARRGR